MWEGLPRAASPKGRNEHETSGARAPAAAGGAHILLTDASRPGGHVRRVQSDREDRGQQDEGAGGVASLGPVLCKGVRLFGRLV